jgi:hypothetical protein
VRANDQLRQELATAHFEITKAIHAYDTNNIDLLRAAFEAAKEALARASATQRPTDHR